jgi:hypothetical protein
VRLSVKDIENIGAGIVRSDLLKKSIRGKKYRATVYFEDDSVETVILFYKNGGSRLLGPYGKDDNNSAKFNSFKRFVSDKIIVMKKSNIITKVSGWSVVISIIPTTLVALSYRGPVDLPFIVVDILALITLVHIYRRERVVYVKKA